MRIILFMGLTSCGFISEIELEARFDQDADGFEAVRFGGQDCDDDDRDVHPDAVEVCDKRDNDCDGTVDSDALDRRTWYRDLDEDGYGRSTGGSTSCEGPSGYVDDSSDCDDSVAAINPAADEICDGVDNNGDGNIDEGYDADRHPRVEEGCFRRCNRNIAV